MKNKLAVPPFKKYLDKMTSKNFSKTYKVLKKISHYSYRVHSYNQNIITQMHFVLQHKTYINSYMFRLVGLCCNKSLKMAPQRRNMYEFMYVMRVVSESAFVQLCTAFKIKAPCSSETSERARLFATHCSILVDQNP